MAGDGAWAQAAPGSVEAARAALAAAETREGPRSPKLTSEIFALARALSEAGDHRGAADALVKGRSLTFAHDREGAGRRAGFGIDAADQLIVAGDLVGAQKLLQGLRAEVEAAFGIDAPEVGQILYRLGQCARKLGNKTEAETLGRKAYALLSASTDPADKPEAIEAGVSLAVTLYNHDRNAEARDVAQSVLVLGQSMPAPDPTSMAAMRKILAQIDTETADVNTRLSLARQKLAEAETAFGTNDPRLAAPIDELIAAIDQWAARMNRDSAREEVLVLIRRGAALQWGDTPQEGAQQNRFRLDESYWLLRLNRPAEALASAQTLLPLVKERFGEASAQAGLVENRIGGALEDLDRDTEAAAHYERAARLLASASEPEARRARVAVGLNRAKTLRYLNRKAEALAVAEEAQSLARGVEGLDTQTTTRLDALVKELRQALLDRAQRLTHAKADLEAAEKTLKPGDTRLAPLVDALGDAYELTGDHANAADHWRRAAELTPGEDEAAVEARMTLYVAAATALRAVDRWDDGLSLLRTTLREVEVRFGATSTKAGEVHNRIGVLLSDLGREEEALAEFATAMRLFDGDPQALDRQITTRNNLSSTLFDFSRYEAAVTVAREGLVRVAQQAKPDEALRRSLAARIERATAALAVEAARNARPPDAQLAAAIEAAQTALNVAEATAGPEALALAKPLADLAQAFEAAEQWEKAAGQRLRIGALAWGTTPEEADAAAQAFNHAAHDYRMANTPARAILAARAGATAAARGGKALLVADMENRLGVVLAAADRKDESTRHFERAAAVLAGETTPTHRLRLSQYGFNLAAVLTDLDRDQEGFEVARRTWKTLAGLGDEARDLRRSLARTLQVTARVIANGHFQAGRVEAAIEPLRFAADVAQIPGMVAPQDVFLTFRRLDYAYYQTGRFAEAESAGRSALAAALAASGDPKRDEQVASSMENLANTLDRLGRNGDGEDFAAQALTIRRAIDPKSLLSLRSMVRLSAFIADREGASPRALALAQEAVAIYEGLQVEDKAEYHTALGNYAFLLRSAARDAEAEKIDIKVLASSARIAGKDSLPHGNALIGASNTLENLGRAKDAAAMRRQGLGLVRRFAAPESDHLVNALIATANLWEKDRANLLWEALAIVEKKSSDEKGRMAEIVRNLATDLIANGSPSEAIALIERAEAALNRRPEAQRQRRDDDLTRMALLGSRVAAAKAMKDYATMEPLARQRVEMANRLMGPDAPITGEILSILTIALDGQGRFAESEALHRKVLTLRQAKLPKGHPDIASSQHNLAFALHRLGRDKEALPLERAAVAATRKADNPDRLGLSRLLRALARIETALGQHRAALGHAAEAVRRSIAAAKIENDPLGAERARRLAEARDVFVADVDVIWQASRQPQRPKARHKAPPKALPIPPAEADAAGIGAPAAQPKLAARPKPVPPSLPSATVLMDRAFVSAQWATSTAAAAALAKTAARFASGDDALARTVRARQDLVEEIGALDRRLNQALASEAAEERKRAQELRQMIEQRKTALGGLDKEIEVRFPRYAALANPAPARLAEVRAALKPGEAMVKILTTDDAGYVFVVTPAAARWTRVPMKRAELEEMIQRLRANLGASPQPAARGGARGAENLDGEAVASGGRAFDRAAAHALYKAYLAPFADMLVKDAAVYFVLSGAWTSLPPAVLVTRAPSGGDSDPEALRTTQWFLRDHSVAILPSVSSLASLRQLGATSGSNMSEPFAGFGAPVLGGTDIAAKSGDVERLSRGGLADVQQVRQLASLPQTEGELRRLAQALNAPETSVTLGANATEARVRTARLANVRVLAFATHGLVAGEISGLAEPALVFTPPPVASEDDDGLLTASEAAGLNLSADWVILSACNTASSDGRPGAEALSGLARSFFYAGARSLLVSHWPVDDAAAARLTSATLNRTTGKDRLGRAEALRRSMLDLMADRDNPQMAHPVMWAPFVVVGEGR